MESKGNLLVTLADRNYVEQAKQLFSSVYWNAGWEGEYMLLAHDIPEDELKWFKEKGIIIHKCQPLHDMSIGMNYSPIVLDKFYLFTIEFRKWKNIIYLDSDIIVRGSLNYLTNIKGFGAVISTLKFSEQFAIGSELYNELITNYKLNSISCNTGIMAFSTDIIFDETFEKLTALFDKYHPIIHYADEAILNLYFFKKWKKLPRIFGLDITLLMNFHFKYKRIRALVLHFIRNDYFRFKPWMPEHPFYEEWSSNYARADLIESGKVQFTRMLPKFKIYYYSYLYDFYVFYIFHLYKPFQWMRNALIWIVHIPDKIIGIAGMVLIKINPNFYYKIKKIISCKK
jgi:lipopolysaccharide biosynthesis glycosyltransferase